MESDKLYVDRLKEADLDVKEVADSSILLNFKESIAKQGNKVDTQKKSKSSICQALLDQLKSFVENCIGKDQSLIQGALKAYDSAVSSYTSYSLKDKKIFNYKEVNLTDLVR